MATTTPARRSNRTLSAWDPFGDMESLFGRFLGRGGDLAAPGAAWAPRVDISEDQDSYRIDAELPGISREDIILDVRNGVITLSGERRSEEHHEEATRHRVERSYGSFSRSFALPEGIDEDRIEATFKDGVLTVSVPKAPGSEDEARRIEVKG